MSIALLLADYPRISVFESEMLLPSAISRISLVEHLVADLPQTKATSTPSSSIRPNLFNVMAVSRALQNIVSTEANRPSVDFPCALPSPCSGKDSLFIQLASKTWK
jgi:hypothetical protein